ncbi:MAG: hypothetical protein JXE06_10665 [Coriobacteriia bacterium]|nr:hypothetical protein [Coriobacteriia bacterium]
MTRDMCGLARVLDDSDYSALGGVDGDYRVAKVFHDFSVARWVNDDNHKAAYDFGDSISPTASFGYFAKNDTAVGGYNCYEIAVPPEFLVGGDHDSTWVSVPGNGSDPDAGCTDGWNDPRDTTYCDNTYCDPVKVRLWGSYYIGFAADTDYYDSGDDDRYLQIKVNWEEEAMHDSTELWVTVLKYNASEDSLFLRGDNVTWSATDQFSPSDSVVVNVTDFCEGGNEAAALVLSLVPTTFDTITVPCSYGLLPKRYNCMPRVAWDSTGARHDLPFEYSFAVLQEESGGSCPYRKLPRQADSS